MTPTEHLHDGHSYSKSLAITGLESCPTCDQVIPLERIAEVAGKLAARDRQRAADLAARLGEQFARERAEDRAAAEAILQQTKNDNAAALERAAAQAAQNEATIREQLRREADVTLQAQLAEVARSRAETEDALRRQIDEAEHTKVELARAHAAALETLRAEAAHSEVTLREQLRQEAAATLQSQLAEVALARAETEGTLRRQLDDSEEAKVQLAQANAQTAAALETLRAEAAQTEARVRAEVTQAAEASAQQRIAELQEQSRVALAESEARHASARESDAATVADLRQQLAQSQQSAQNALAEEQARHQASKSAAQAAVADAQSRLAEAEEGRRTLTEEMRGLQESRDAAISQAVQETRETLEKATVVAVQAEQAKRFEETQKLSAQLEDVQRQLANKTAQELGEGAELDLFEELKATFEDDLITRVGRGVAGPDIIHDIRENGQICGRIIYDCKNRKDWKNEYSLKLSADKVNAQADHAVLSTNKFPAGEKQLHQRDGVILACPARVLVVAEVLRDHVLRMHQLRVSNEERDEKTAQLYAFMTGDRCNQLFGSFDTQFTKLEEIEITEHKQHTAIWEKRGTAIKLMQKAQGDLRFEINRIIGTAGISGES